jgi:uncharacterized protein
MEDNYEKLRGLLAEKNFPMVYLFKFIIKKDEDKMIRIRQIFEEIAEFSQRESKNGNYNAITIKQMMLNADDIIDKYVQMEKIEGVITL